jgi:Tfp pilus assembly protein PilP
LVQKILMALVVALAALTSTAVNATRIQEALEQFELSSLKLVSLSPNPEPRLRSAYIQDPKGYWYLVIEGSYMGKDQGRIREISVKGIHLVEIVPDGSGGWKEVEVLVEPAYRSSGSQSNQSFKADGVPPRP